MLPEPGTAGVERTRVRPLGIGGRSAAEAVGSAFLLTAVVGSGIMGERLASGNAAITLLANSLATGAALVALIATLGPVSGAHLNPIVTAVQAIRGALPFKEAGSYVVAQVAGAVVGVAVAHAMFGEPVFSASSHARAGASQTLSELVATFGLVMVVWGTSRMGPYLPAMAVAGYITAGYWFTASTCFANPAVTLARSMTDTFAGIRPADVPMFVVAQVLGGAVAIAFGRWVFRPVAAARSEMPSPNPNIR